MIKKVLILLFMPLCVLNAEEYKLYYNENSEVLRFAIGELELSLSKTGHTIAHQKKDQLTTNLNAGDIVFVLESDKKLLQILRKFVDPQITFSIIRKYFANP